MAGKRYEVKMKTALGSKTVIIGAKDSKDAREKAAGSLHERQSPTIVGIEELEGTKEDKPADACVVCYGPATRRLAPTRGHAEIDCPDCGRFQASAMFEAAAGKHSIAVRRRSLENARIRAHYGALPVITTYDLP